MIKARIEKTLGLNYESKLLIVDKSRFISIFDYIELLKKRGFVIYEYIHVEKFRVIYEEQIKSSFEKIAVVVTSDIYIPYDVHQSFKVIDLSLAYLFPNLHSDTIREYIRDLDLISFAYDSCCYSDINTPSQTEMFIQKIVLDITTIERYCQTKTNELRNLCNLAKDYPDWIAVAKQKAVIDYYAAMKNITIDLTFTDESFLHFIADGYGKLSSDVNKLYPVIITKTLNVVCENHNEKTALIVMDGMSLFDFEVVSRFLGDFTYEYHCSFAMIPTTTPISRQSLLSGKYPRELDKPFSLANEEKEFVAAGLNFGYTTNQIQYLRGYNFDISPFTKLVAVIINEIDDIVHGQRQSRIGMYNDMTVLGQSGNLKRIITRLLELGFSVYITADHGNTPCIGVGRFRNGIEIETRSMRMAVLKDFAEGNVLLFENTTEYAGFYLNRNYRYYICNQSVSFDSKGESVMTHGGMSLDEVIVPFIRIKGVE